MIGRWSAALLGPTLVSALTLAAAPALAEATETIDQAACRLIEGAAGRTGIPGDLLTRLIWRESTFRPDVQSPKGAQGIAQFMPGTALEQGLTDPFDIEAAIPAAAGFLSELHHHFGSLGLAVAAYNAGPNRVDRWMASRDAPKLQPRVGLPLETQDYVLAITGRVAVDWAADARTPAIHAEAALPPAPVPCATVVAGLRKGTAPLLAASTLSPWAPWGVQLAGNFSKTRALAIFARFQGRYSGVLAGVRPMIIGTRLRSRGTHAFYRVRAPAQTRAQADALCRKIRGAGGPCLVLRS